MIFLCVAAGVVAVALLCADHKHSERLCERVCADVNVSEWVSVCLFVCMVFLECSHSSVIHCRVSPFCTIEFIESICLFMYLGNMRTHTPFTSHSFSCVFLSSTSLRLSSILLESFPWAWKFMIFWYANCVLCIKFMCLKTTFHSLFGRFVQALSHVFACSKCDKKFLSRTEYLHCLHRRCRTDRRLYSMQQQLSSQKYAC